MTAKKDFVSTSYVSPVMQGFDERCVLLVISFPSRVGTCPSIVLIRSSTVPLASAKAAGVTILNEIGVDPGIDHLYAMKMIDQVHEEGGKVSPD